MFSLLLGPLQGDVGLLKMTCIKLTVSGGAVMNGDMNNGGAVAHV
jgi:hypothetical protein